VIFYSEFRGRNKERSSSFSFTVQEEIGEGEKEAGVHASFVSFFTRKIGRG